MELKTILSILSGILFLGIYKMVQENKKKSAKIEIRKRQKALEAKAVKSFNNSEESNHPISNSIKRCYSTKIYKSYLNSPLQILHKTFIVTAIIRL